MKNSVMFIVLAKNKQENIICICSFPSNEATLFETQNPSSTYILYPVPTPMMYCDIMWLFVYLFD